MNTAVDTDLHERAARMAGRISKLEHEGKTYWVKHREKLSLRMRLQKGPGAPAFEREREALHKLEALGAPAPRIVAEGPEFFVIPDSGVSLRKMLRKDLGADGERRTAFVEAARALAWMHSHHLTHGNPRPKDILWKDGRITLIDFERFAEQRNTPRGHAQDVAIFVFSTIADAGGPTPELDAACETYRANDPGGIWEEAREVARRYRFMNWLTLPLRFRREGKAREFKAIPETLEYLGLA